MSVVGLPLSSASIEGLLASYSYSGSPIVPSFTLRYNGTLLNPATDYTTSITNNLNAGTATMVITGKGSYSGTITRTFRIARAEISQATVTGINASYPYTGKEIAPQPTVTLNGRVLTPQVDYTLMYYNNISSGSYATIYIMGGGNYTGLITARFRVAFGTGGDIPGGGDTPAETLWTRLSGGGRYETMSAIVGAGFNSSSTVIIATGENYPDALAASGIAGLSNAPVITTPSSHLGDEARGQIARLRPSRAIIIGGEAAVSGGVEQSLAQMGLAVTRLAGTSREATSVRVLNESTAWTSTVIIASGQGFADALSISSYAYAKSAPILLTSGSKTLSEEALDAIRNHGFANAIIVGGPAAVSLEVEAQLAQIGIGAPARLAGADRYATSGIIAQFALSQGMAADNLGVATGANFPDALAGAALCGSRNSVLLLATEELDVLTQLEVFFNQTRGSIHNASVFGGTAAVSSDLFNFLQAQTR